MRFAAGSVLAERYRLGSCLGRGGMGEVWSAVHLVTGRHVAIKRLLSTREQDRDARARFVREARTACAVDHPNVVQVLDFLETGNDPPLLVMELLSGQTLAALLSRTPRLNVENAARLLLPVVSAVGTAHSLGIVHRDLKPSNIYLHERPDGERLVKVLDFGLAKWVASLASASDPRTKDGFAHGTPRYMAPEQAAGQRTVTHRVDIWALGVLFYECLAGSRPVEGDNLADVVTNLLHKGIIPLEQLIPTLPPDVSKLVGRMLSRDPAERPQDLREAFGVLSSHTTASAPTFGPPDVDLVMVTETPPSSRPAPPGTASLTEPSASGSVDTASVPLPLDARVYRFRRGVTVAAVAAAVIGLVALVVSSLVRAPEALKAGSRCERSRQCASGHCVAFVCQ